MSIENAKITSVGERKFLFIKIDEILMEKLAGKPLIEQMKIMLELVREAKNGDGATEEIKQACELAEKAIMWDMNMVNAGLN